MTPLEAAREAAHAVRVSFDPVPVTPENNDLFAQQCADAALQAALSDEEGLAKAIKVALCRFHVAFGRHACDAVAEDAAAAVRKYLLGEEA